MKKDILNITIVVLLTIIISCNDSSKVDKDRFDEFMITTSAVLKIELPEENELYITRASKTDNYNWGKGYIGEESFDKIKLLINEPLEGKSIQYLLYLDNVFNRIDTISKSNIVGLSVIRLQNDQLKHDLFLKNGNRFTKFDGLTANINSIECNVFKKIAIEYTNREHHSSRSIYQISSREFDYNEIYDKEMKDDLKDSLEQKYLSKRNYYQIVELPDTIFTIELLKENRINWDSKSQKIIKDENYFELGKEYLKNKNLLIDLILNELSTDIKVQYHNGNIKLGDIAYLFVEDYEKLSRFEILGQYDVIHIGSPYPDGLFEGINANRREIVKRIYQTIQ